MKNTYSDSVLIAQQKIQEANNADNVGALDARDLCIKEALAALTASIEPATPSSVSGE